MEQKTNSVEQIKRLEQLNKYLQQNRGKQPQPSAKMRLAKSTDMVGLNQKTNNQRASKIESKQIEMQKTEESEKDETRSVKAEFDYQSKGAARNIVVEQSFKRQQMLREKVIKNLESIKQNKPAEMSLKSELKSLKSRISNTSKMNTSIPLQTEP